MAALNIKATHKVVKTYYDEINQLGNLNLPYEGAVSPAFAALLRHCGRQFKWTLAEQFPMKPSNYERARCYHLDSFLTTCLVFRQSGSLGW